MLGRLRFTAIAAALLGLSAANSACASVVNGSFEQSGGSFSGWTAIGNAMVVGTFDSNTAPDGQFHAGMSTGDAEFGTSAPVSAAALETFLGLSPGALTGVGGAEGSAIRQVFTVSGVGPNDYPYKFRWRFLTNEANPSFGVNDRAFAVIDGVVTFLAQTVDATDNYGGAVFARRTGYNFFETTITVPPGTHSIGFGVMDVVDGRVASGLLIDNVVAIPEPTSMALCGLGLIGMAGVSWARRRKKADKAAAVAA